jgi:superfamily II DNA or RNA helicase
MNSIFSTGAYLKTKEYVRNYTKKVDNKIYSAVGVRSDYICYPYDLVWKYEEKFDKVPTLKYIEDELYNSIKLRDYQQEIVDKLLPEPRGILISPPGTGKTVMMLYLIAQLNLKTLILVNSVFLLNQWREECEKLLGYIPGKIGEGEFTINDITVATFQSLRKEERLKQVWNKFSLVIVDECHRVPANTFRLVLNNIEAYWKLGVTGTYKRKDRLEFLADWMLSDKKVVNEYDDTMLPQVVIVKTGIALPESDGYVECLNNIEDNEKLLNTIKENVEKGKDRHQLILSFRLETVDKLAEMFPDALVITGSSSAEERENLNEKIKEHKLIISTTLQEGVNIPNLDTLHLIHPNNNLPMLEQRIKRINRPVDGKKTPLVFDYWYKQGRCKGFNVHNQQMIRLAFYNKKGYKVYVV